MSTPRLIVDNITKSFESAVRLAGFTCSIGEGEILGLIGPNGAGKTTLFNVVCGLVAPDSGDVVLNGKSLIGLPPHEIACAGISRTFQKLRLIRQMSVLDNVMLSFRGQPGEGLANIFFKWSECLQDEAANEKDAMSLLEKAGLGHKAAAPAGELSYGQQKLLSIVCTLAANGDVFLLDEPVAGIAPETIDTTLAVIRSLPRRGKSVIVIEHNLEAVMSVCDRVIFMVAGNKVSEGTPEAVRNDPKVVEAYWGSTYVA